MPKSIWLTDEQYQQITEAARHCGFRVQRGRGSQVDVAWLKQRYLKYFGYEIPQTQINVFTPEFLAFCLYIIQEASYLGKSDE